MIYYLLVYYLNTDMVDLNPRHAAKLECSNSNTPNIGAVIDNNTS